MDKIQEALDLLSKVDINDLPKEQRVVLKTLLGKSSTLPQHWGKTTNAPYYREHYALELKTHLDDWEANPEHDIKFYCKKFRATKLTLVQRINQSWMYLMDYLDPDGKYKNLRKRVEVVREHDGVRVVWKNYYRPDWTPDKVPRLEHVYKWKTELNEFVETAKLEERCKWTGLKLTENDQRYIRELVSHLPHFYILTLSYSVLEIARMEIPEPEEDDTRNSNEASQ